MKTHSKNKTLYQQLVTFSKYEQYYIKIYTTYEDLGENTYFKFVWAKEYNFTLILSCPIYTKIYFMYQYSVVGVFCLSLLLLI